MIEKKIYKLLNNAVYGKTMENLRLRTDIRLVSKRDGPGKNVGRKLVAMPNFKNCKIFDRNLVAIEMNKSLILMNKPIIVGMCILEISKVLMYRFLYNYLKPKYGQNVTVCQTDTDAFLLEIKGHNVYSDIRDDPFMFDTSDYPEGINKKVPGEFKDELNGEIVTEFVGLRSKCYGLRTQGKVDKMKKAKWVKKNVLKNKVTFDDYFDCIKNNCIEMRSQCTFRSKNHTVYTIATEKIALKPFDDKRYIIKPDGIDTLSWGHYRLDNEKMNEEYEYASNIVHCKRKILKK